MYLKYLYSCNQVLVSKYEKELSLFTKADMFLKEITDLRKYSVFKELFEKRFF